MERLRNLAFGLLPFVLASCMVGPNYQTPKAPVAEHWATNTPASAKPLPLADAYWWKTFNDPVLNDLVELSYRNNLSLQVAGVRVLQARAQLNQSLATCFRSSRVCPGELTTQS